MARSRPTTAGVGSADLPKAATGIAGFDAITLGGLPAGRPTLVCGAAGCGKTLFGVTFLVNGAVQYDEPGVLMTFEERPEDIVANVASLGYDIPRLIAEKKLAIDHVRLDPGEIEESGEYDLEGLFVRLDYAIKKTGAKRVVMDTTEALFAGLSNQAILRAELRRLFEWFKERKITAVITGERGNVGLTRHGLEEYVSDCVILLDNRTVDQATTRRLRVIKYRGSAHGTNEYPFLIDEDGISVLPVTAVGLGHAATDETVSTGIPPLDQMMGGKGYYRGSTVLVTGTSGTGKTTFAAHFANSVCAAGDRCFYMAFEESPDQIVRNMRSIGLDLARHVASGNLLIQAARPTLYGLEMHLARMMRDLDRFRPAAVVLDPISALRGPDVEVQGTLLQMVDILKSRGITAVMTALGTPAEGMSRTEHIASSLMDTWISLIDIEANGEHNRTLYILKSRGMAHSNQIREYVLSDAGIEFAQAYVWPRGVLTGSARLAQEAQERADAIRREQEVERRRGEIAQKRAALDRQIDELRAAMKAEEDALNIVIHEEEERVRLLQRDREEMSEKRGGNDG